MGLWVCLSMYVCVCVCERERERRGGGGVSGIPVTCIHRLYSLLQVPSRIAFNKILVC